MFVARIAIRFCCTATGTYIPANYPAGAPATGTTDSEPPSAPRGDRWRSRVFSRSGMLPLQPPSTSTRAGRCTPTSQLPGVAALTALALLEAQAELIVGLQHLGVCAGHTG
ncbi:Uncharacterised protein [Mycobacteroides abscessus subsp. abscessus]|nr:Uncharacterised protein [Mycobacteroides abscessus subsp. abscessus]